MRILVVDEHGILRRGLVHLLEREADLEVVGQVGDGDEVLPFLREHEVDILVLDLQMPGQSGFSALREIRDTYPDLPILILSSHEEERYALRSLKAGASGYLCKNRALEDLVDALRLVMNGRRYLPEDVAEKIFSRLDGSIELNSHDFLSEQEFEVLLHSIRGYTLKETADRMDLSPKTISTYRARLKEKLGVGTQAEVFQYALDTGLISKDY